MTFDIFLDIIESSLRISGVDFEEETKSTKGVIHFKYRGKKFNAIFVDNFLKSIEEVS